MSPNRCSRSVRSTHRQAFILPKKLPKRSFGEFFKLRSKDPSKQKNLRKLRSEIENYVEENAIKLVKQLNAMAVYRNEIRESKRRSFPINLARSLRDERAFHRNSTYVLIAGQASQFQPIGKALKSAFKSLGLPPSNVHFLQGSLAKEACCKGAIGFLAAMHKELNPEELHGSYGFLRVAAIGKANLFKAVNMAKIKKGLKDEISFSTKAEYWFIYSPLPYFEDDKVPELNDGYTALISKEVGAKFEVEYDPGTRKMKINNKPIKKLGNFGDVYESIFPKVWPEAVNRKKGNEK